MRSFQEFKWLSTSFTEEEAKAVKKAFEQVSLRKPLFLEEWKWSKEKTLDWCNRKEEQDHEKLQ